MKLHPADIVLWVILSIAEAILATAILKRGAARRWPFLLALCLFDLLLTSELASHTSNYRAFFYIYWYGHGIRSLLNLGLLWDVFRSLPALKYVPKRIGLTLLTVGITVTLGSVFLTALHHPNTAYKITYEVLMIRECVTVLWMCCAATLLGSISFLGLGWGVEAVKITSGFVVFGIAAMLAASLTSSWPHQGQLLDKLQTCCEIAVFFSWIKALFSVTGEFSSASALEY